MKILVTGATGYIGAHVVETLYGHGHNVIATDIDNNQNNVSPYIDHFFQWDIRNPSNIKDWYDKVIHIGAETKVNKSTKDPYNYYLTNVNGTYNVLQHADTPHFIYCSTGSAFQPESSPYAATKYGGELVTKQFRPGQNTIVRFYNVSGNNGFKKYDDEISHLIRKAARVVNAIKYRANDFDHRAISIFGTDYDTRDGTCVRNYTHVNDIVNGIINVVNDAPTDEIVCLGSPEGFTVREVIDTMKKVSGIDFKVIEGPRRDGDIPVSTVPYASKYFKQEYSLEDMCRDAIKYEVFE